MKPIVKIISLAFALAWINSAVAETGITPAAGENGAASAVAASKIPLEAKPENVNRAKVEKRLSDRAARTKKRTATAQQAATGRGTQAPVAGDAQK